MTKKRRIAVAATGVAAAITLLTPAAAAPQAGDSTAGSGAFQFEPLPSSAPCTEGGNGRQPFALPPGYQQTVIAQEGDGGTRDLWDMNTLNETGPRARKFLYRTHETRSYSQVSVTNLETGVTRVLSERPDWERFDGIVWTPWGTILAAEETTRSAFPDPAVPQANAGLVYEIDPITGAAVARPAIGSRSHEGLRFDAEGNLYGISERAPGYVYRFTPDERGDLSTGQLYALKVTAPTGDRTGEAIWVPLDRASVQVDSDAAASAVGATPYPRPEDVETARSTGNNHQGGVNVLYVAITGEDRVLKIDLREPRGGSEHLTAFVSDYVRDGLNAPADFDAPDNLALDHAGNLYITEDPGGTAARGKTLGDDIWVAEPRQGQPAEGDPAERTVRFASLTDCEGEPTGIYFDRIADILYVNAQHRGGDGVDLGMAITEVDDGNQ